MEAIDPQLVYRDMVRAAAESGDEEPDAGILLAAMKLPLDFRTDLKTLRRRREAARVLSEEVPRLEREAAEAASAYAKTGPGGGLRPVTDFPTVAELSDAIMTYQNRLNPVWATPEQLAATDTASCISTVKGDAKRVLAESANPSISEKTKQLAERIAQLERAIAARPTRANIEAQLAKETAVVKELATGNLPRRYAAYGDFRPVKVVWRQVRAKIAQLQTALAAAPEVDEQSEADRKEIERLRAEIAKNNARWFDPDGGMRWSE